MTSFTVTIPAADLTLQRVTEDRIAKDRIAKERACLVAYAEARAKWDEAERAIKAAEEATEAAFAAEAACGDKPACACGENQGPECEGCSAYVPTERKV